MSTWGSSFKMADLIRYRKGRLAMEGAGLEALARRFGTPAFAYSRATVLARLADLRKAFRHRETLICYALKANPTRALCRVLAREGAGAEVVSGGELWRALRAGFEPRKVVFSGVGKTEEELALALRRRILAINLESRGEMEALSRLARRLRIKAPIAVRLNPDIDANTHMRITTGKALNKFGVERKEALRMYGLARNDPWLKIKGIQCHIGSQIGRIEPFKKAARSVARLVRDLQGEGIAIEWIDLGGGIGVSYWLEPSPNLVSLARTMEESLSGLPAKLIIEPGRYLVADSGVLLTKILYRKRTTRRSFLVVDAGLNDLARPALYGARHPIVPCREKKGGSNRLETVDIVGPLCETGDYLAHGRRIPRCEAGEILAVLKCGAYGSSMSSQYNSRPRAAEILVEGPRGRLIKRRERLEDLTRLEE